MMIYLGAKRFPKKDNSGFFHMVEYAGPFNDKESQAGSIGLKTFESFVSADVYNTLIAQGTGIICKECAFDFVMNNNGRPEICNVRILDK